METADSDSIPGCTSMQGSKEPHIQQQSRIPIDCLTEQEAEELATTFTCRAWPQSDILLIQGKMTWGVYGRSEWSSPGGRNSHLFLSVVHFHTSVGLPALSKQLTVLTQIAHLISLLPYPHSAWLR